MVDNRDTISLYQHRKIYQKILIKRKKNVTHLFFIMIIGNLNVHITHLSQEFMHVKRMPIKLLFLVCR